MEMRTIGSLKVSVVGLGCNNFGMRIGRKETAAVVDAALDAGINFFDTADIYGGTKSETYLGRGAGRPAGRHRAGHQVRRALRGPRGRGVGGVHPHGRRGQPRPGSAPTASTSTSCTCPTRRRRSPRPSVRWPSSSPRARSASSAAPTSRSPCSRRRPRSRRAGSPGFVSVQNEYNILHREPEDGVLEYCDRTGMAFLPYFPLASGLLSGKYRAGEPPPEGTRLAAMGDRAASQLTDERLATVAALDELARRHGHTVLDLAFGWLLSRPAVASVIAGATRPEQIAANVAAGEWRPATTCWPRSTRSRPGSYAALLAEGRLAAPVPRRARAARTGARWTSRL